ncbi:unnamed protein product [Oreochromis niloticus]|nr:unnamed protein product [Mustela putorius furo]
MWRLVLTLTLFCWGSEGQPQPVTCRDNNGGEVDWFIIYKAPGEMISGTRTYKKEMKYFYTDSALTVSHMLPGTSSYKNLNDPSGALANTLRPVLKKIRNMPPNFGFISYSDQPPGCHAQLDFGHSKGVIMVEKNNYGVWLLHSTPQFPFRRDQNKFWPDSGFRNAQTFICVTFPYNEFRNIGTHLQYIGAFPFEHDIPDDFHQELINVTKWIKADPPNNHQTNYQTLTSRRGQRFLSIPKQVKTTDGDLYYTIAKSVSSHVYVQTWGCQKGRTPSDCSDQLHKVYNIKTIKNVLGPQSTWEPKSDHSKWCVTKSQNKAWTCIADVNRAETQYARRGGALCIENEAVRKKFLEFAQDFEECTSIMTPSIMDTDTDCDTSD